MAKNRKQFIAVLGLFTRRLAIDLSSSVLVVGGSDSDASSLLDIGFKNIVLSNLDGVDSDYREKIKIIKVDLENSPLRERVFDIVFIHEVLHHCRSPHKALCEALRMARKYVIMLEPNDSSLMRVLTRLQLSFPYEIAAVVDNGFVGGGVRNSGIPSYIYRWTVRETFKTTASFLAEYNFDIDPFPYWDFSIDSFQLSLRKQTRIPLIANLIGPDNFLGFLKVVQFAANSVPLLRKQGNKYFCVIEKGDSLKPWLTEAGEKIIFNHNFDSPGKKQNLLKA